LVFVRSAEFPVSTEDTGIQSDPDDADTNATAVAEPAFPPISVVQLGGDVPLLLKTCPAVPTAKNAVVSTPD
jgi:hypothetical protein